MISFLEQKKLKNEVVHYCIVTDYSRISRERDMLKEKIGIIEKLGLKVLVLKDAD